MWKSERMISETPETMPRRATLGSAGYDFYSPEEYKLFPGIWTTIDTGIKFDGTEYPYFTHQGRPIPDDGYPHTVCVTYPTSWFMAIVPRSGLSFKYGLRIINTVAIIDKDYRDTIKLKVTVEQSYTLKKGERFAQGIFLPFGIMSGEVKPTESRNGGFGSTGQV